MEEEKKNKLIQLFLFIIFSFNSLIAQPDNRFDPFDWEIYGESGRINSISEDNTYFYFGTENAGILRFNKFSEQFDIPITQAQGLHSESVKHVYFDKNTGILWVVGDEFIEYSFSKTGGWQKSTLNKARILDIGSSNNYLWLRSGPNFTKLDHVNGVELGTYSYPDESNINWGDVSFNYIAIINNLLNFNLNDYFIEDAWLLTTNGASDSRGDFLKYKSYYKSEHRLSWIGLDDGTLLQIDNFSKSIKPIFYGLGTHSIRDVLVDNDLIWIVGRGGITKFDTVQNTSEVLKPEEYFQFNGTTISCLIKVDDEIWFGSDDGYMLIYNIKKDSFKQFGDFYGINDFVLRDDKVWVSSRISRDLYDIFAIDKESKKKLGDQIPDMVNKSWSEVLEMRFNVKSRSIDSTFYQDGNIYISRLDGIYEYNIDNPLSFAEYDRNIPDLRKIVNSTLYFNSFVRDLLVIEKKILVATNRGLFIVDLESGELLERYTFFNIGELDSFSFLRDIVKINYFSDFLVLLTRNGLVKFNVEL